MSEAAGFDYSNLSGRPSGPFLRTLSRLVPGVGRVQAQVAPYAEAWAGANRRALAGSGPLWVALGDSLTQGIGASSYDAGWVDQLVPMLPTALTGVRVVNLSFYGARVPDLVDRQLPALLSLGVTPDLVTVLVGNNDLVSREFRPTLDASMATLLARLPAGSVVANQPGGRAAVRSLNRVIEAGVAEHDLVLADMRDPRMTSWRGKLSSDMFHPNDRGYTGIAEIFAETLARH